MTDDGPPSSDEPSTPWLPPSTEPALPAAESALPPGWSPMDTAASAGYLPANNDPIAPASEIYGYRPPPTYANPLAAHKPGIIPLRPLGVADILTGAITAITSNLKVVAAISAVAAVINAVINLLVSALTELVDADGGVRTAIGTLGGIITLSIAATILLTGLLTGTLSYPMSRATLGRYPSLTQTWDRLRPRLGSIAGVSGIAFVIATVPLLLAASVLAAAGAAASSALAVLGAFVAVVGMITLVALMTFISFALPITTLEGLGPMDSVRRSVALVRPLFWRVLGIALLAGLIVGIAQSVITSPADLIGSFTEEVSGGAEATALKVAFTTVLTAISDFLLLPFIAAVTTLLYTDARIRLEGFDITLIAAAAQSSEPAS